MSLDEVRQKIDSIDQQLLRLLNERAELVHAVGEIKRKDDLDIYVPGREDKLLRKLAEINRAHKTAASPSGPSAPSTARS
jgi:chorismate mutase/prephenate dehydratase